MHAVQIEDLGYVSKKQLEALGYPDFVMNFAEEDNIMSFIGRLAVMISSGLAVRYERLY